MSIDYAVGGAVATITLARPERLNALDQPMTVALLEAVSQAAHDPQVRAVVLTGAGRGFCSGGDSAAPATIDFADVEAEIAWTRAHTEVSALLAGMDKPTIAAVNGPCAGVGMSFALACDLRIAAEGAVFVTAYRRAGLPGDGAIAWTLSRLVGAGRARELMLLSPRVEAHQALAMGLVNQVVEGAQLLAVAGEIAADLVAVPHRVIAAMKADFLDADRLDISSYLDVETERHVRCRY